MTEAEQIEIFGLATKVGAYGYIRNEEETPYEWIFSPDEIIAFAKLVAEKAATKEREACVKLCEGFRETIWEYHEEHMSGAIQTDHWSFAPFRPNTRCVVLRDAD